MSEQQFSNPAGLAEAIRRASQRLRPDWVEPADRARQALLEAAEAAREALPMPDGLRVEKKIRNLADRWFPGTAEEV